MSIKSIVLSEIEQVAEQMEKELPSLTDDLILTRSGLDSLGFAILVARLEDKLGFDPFTSSDGTSYPVTIGDLIRLYEDAAQSSDMLAQPR
jgi:acyl carrier protein